MLCPKCQQDVAPHYVACPHCDFHLGFPNVREATAQAECDQLDRRYGAARDDARQRNCETVLAGFEDAVRQSHAVICRRWGTLTSISERGNQLFSTYYRQVDAGDRQPQDNEYDRARLAVDATFFPYFHKLVHFAALSLDGLGPSGYGECSFVLRERAVAHKSSVFEKNTLVFCRGHVIPVGQRPPAGYRAAWSERHRLAAAKLGSEISAQTTSADFPAILLKQKGAPDTDEFIEVHVYGTLDLTSVERFRAPKPKLPEDVVLARRLLRRLKECGIQVETTPCKP
jgi:hypothetical protein